MMLISSMTAARQRSRDFRASARYQGQAASHMMRKIAWVAFAGLALPGITLAEDIGSRIERRDVVACQTPEQADHHRWSANEDHGDQSAVPGCFDITGAQIVRRYMDGDAPMVLTLDGRRLHLDNTPTPDEGQAMAAAMRKQASDRAIDLTIRPEHGATTPAASMLFGR